MTRGITAKALSLAAIAAGLLGAAEPASAHAFGQRYDLPVPLHLYLFGAAAAVAFSFVVVGVFLRDVRWSRDYPRFDLLRTPVGRGLAHPAPVFAVKLAAVLAFLLVLAAGFLGNQHPMRNIAPPLVWIIGWVGLVYLSAFVGELWTVINPWRTLFAWAEALFRRFGGGELSRRRPYPEALGAWPAVALLMAFAWAELVFPEPAVPANVAAMVLTYSCVTWAGMFLYGREQWLRRGEAFSLLFGIFARFAPSEARVSRPAVCRACGLGCLDGDGHCVNCATCFGQASDADREWALRPYAVGLLRNEAVPASLTAFVLLLLAVVLYDGLLATPSWARFEELALALVAAPEAPSRLAFRSAGLVAFWLVFLGAYLATCRVMVALSGGRGATLATANRFVFTLIPIAIAYHLAHYLSFLLVQGQYVLPLASDPFGLGWDLFGSAGYKVDITVVGARFAWYVAVGAIVVGHIVAVFLAHVLAVTTADLRRRALASQYAMTALMVVFTVTSLSILAEPIVQRPSAGGAGLADAVAALPVPEEALLPEPGSGLLKPVGPGHVAHVGLRYGAMTSMFHDGTRVSAADVLYAYSLAFRWGGTGAADASRHDPEVARATALLRERLAGIRVAGTDKSSKTIRFGEFAFVRELLLVDVYLRDSPVGVEQGAAIAPPWSSVPWHVLALMEEAVARGWASFSQRGAALSGLPWLDLARSPALNAKLATLLDELAGQGFVPAPIAHLVSKEEARQRWAALKAYFAENGHFLVTNGPYRLAAWSDGAVVVKVFRDISYPLGVGSYDSYAIPRRAYIAAVEASAAGLRLKVEVERLEKFMRSYRILREPVDGLDAEGLKGQRLDCRYVVVGDDGRVRLTGQGRLEQDGRVAIDLAGKLAPGGYTVLVALYLNGNTMGPEIRSVPYRAP